MGSFNVTCSLSGLEIEEGDELLYVLLRGDKFVNAATDGIATLAGYESGGYSFKIDSTWKPYLPHFVATYKDYGKVDDIERNHATEILEGDYGLDIQTIVELISGTDFDIYSTTHSIWREVFPLNTEVKEALSKGNSKSESTGEKLVKAGFVEESVLMYSFAGHKLESTTKGWVVWVKGDRPYSLAVAHTHDVKDLLIMFGKFTGVWVGFPEERWKTIHQLSQTTAMYVLKRVFDKLSEYMKDDFFIKRGREMRAEEWKQVHSIYDNKNDPLEVDMRAGSHMSTLARDYSYPIRHRLTSYRNHEKEFGDTLDLAWMFQACNKPIQPTVIAQSGEEDVVKRMMKISLKIIKEREEEYM